MLHIIFVVFLFVIIPSPVASGEIQAPTYQEGEWWRIKVEVSHSGGFSRYGLCEELYPEYFVKVKAGKPKVYGINGKSPEEIDCPTIEAQLLGTGNDKRDYVKFPIKIGKRWEFQYLRAGRLVTAENIVQAVEKVKTSKGELEAFKIERWVEGENTETIWYSPKAKAVLIFDRKTVRTNRKSTVVDFGISPE